ncbi:hypothetical protein GCM10017653_32430 [Ancylobacter defluvii]|uniref:Uncharacterized protein n=1 Tax=Ancylobacter defluvii TaxID=1282440 RepID=A0A9W6JZ58_9HYPH|nr:hypothetical protein GCM10017653_32430 [Ancylobacter defluvii]
MRGWIDAGRRVPGGGSADVDGRGTAGRHERDTRAARAFRGGGLADLPTSKVLTACAAFAPPVKRRLPHRGAGGDKIRTGTVLFHL